MNITEALRHVKAELPEGRYEHSCRVVEQATRLAQIYHVNEEKAGLAAAFHDYAKKRSLDQMKRVILTSSLPKDLLLYHHELWHGPVASILVESLFGITDLEIQDAIRYHTTGRAHMNQLEMIIGLADYIEPSRNFNGLNEVREMAEKDLVKASWLMARNTIQYLTFNKSTIYPDTFHAYNYLSNRLETEK